MGHLRSARRRRPAGEQLIVVGEDHRQAAEQDPDGPLGPQPSWCMTVPTEAVLSMTPQEFVAAEAGKPPYNCKPH